LLWVSHLEIAAVACGDLAKTIAAFFNSLLRTGHRGRASSEQIVDHIAEVLHINTAGVVHIRLRIVTVLVADRWRAFPEDVINDMTKVGHINSTAVINIASNVTTITITA